MEGPCRMFCEVEIPYLPAELFDMSLKKSCFPNCLKNSWKVRVFKNVRERSTAKAMKNL